MIERTSESPLTAFKSSLSSSTNILQIRCARSLSSSTMTSRASGKVARFWMSESVCWKERLEQSPASSTLTMRRSDSGGMTGGSLRDEGADALSSSFLAPASCAELLLPAAAGCADPADGAVEVVASPPLVCSLVDTCCAVAVGASVLLRLTRGFVTVARSCVSESVIAGTLSILGRSSRPRRTMSGTFAVTLPLPFLADAFFELRPARPSCSCRKISAAGSFDVTKKASASMQRCAIRFGTFSPENWGRP